MYSFTLSPSVGVDLARATQDEHLGRAARRRTPSGAEPTSPRRRRTPWLRPWPRVRIASG